MAGIRVVTDSACDLPGPLADELGVEIVPLTIRFGDEEFVDRRDLSPSEFWARCANSPLLPETAAPSPGAFEAAFRRQASAGADAVVCINLSSGLSATIQAAQSAATALAGELDVRTADSRSITSGLGTQVRAAAQAARDGADTDAVVALVEGLAARTHVVGTLDTLENLKKGGRIGAAQALLGSLLSIKPLIDISSGEVTEAGKARTRRKGLEWVRDKVFEQPDVEHLTVAHGMAPDVDAMLDLLSPRYSRDDISITTIGATIGTHGGPRVMGVSWVAPE